MSSTAYGLGATAPAARPDRPDYFLLLTINLSDSFFFLVLNPLVGLPHGVHGCRPPDDLPSPPPIGWSIGFIATPRTFGRRPSQRERPALPMLRFSWSGFPTWPTVAMQRTCTRRCSPLGIRIVAYSPSRAISCAEPPAART